MGKMCWGLIILNCIIKTRMIYFRVSKHFAVLLKLKDIFFNKSGSVFQTEENVINLHRGAKSNSIPPVTYLQCATNAEQPHSMLPDRSSLPRSSRVLIQNISPKCSRDDRKMTLGGLHGHGTVHSTRVGAPMIPRG